MDKGTTDMGQDTFMKNYNDMLRQLGTEEADRLRTKENDQVEKSITDPSVQKNLMDNFMAAREGIVNQDTVKQKQMENIMLNDWRHKNADFRGRMSPMAKELLYKEYLKGATVKNLSL